MNKSRGIREEYVERVNRRAMKAWEEMVPDGAFEDDPAAQNSDRNGRHTNRQVSDYAPGGVDYGRFPPVD